MVLYYSCNCRADQIRKLPANQSHDGNEQCQTKNAGLGGPIIHAAPGSVSLSALPLASAGG
jgi:hypothetical protein